MRRPTLSIRRSGHGVAPEALSRFVDGELDLRPRRELLNHLADCEACRAQVAGYRRFQEHLAEMAGEPRPVPASMDDRVFASVEAQMRRQGQGPSRVASRMMPLAAVMTAVVLLLIGVNRLQPPPVTTTPQTPTATVSQGQLMSKSEHQAQTREFHAFESSSLLVSMAAATTASTVEREDWRT